MALNIPLPGDYGTAFNNGVNSGGSLFSRIMQPIIERERMKQAEAHFQEQLKLQKAAAARAGANSDLQRKLLMQKLDPMRDINQLKLLMREFGGEGKSQQQPTNQASYIPEIEQLLGRGNQSSIPSIPRGLGAEQSFMPSIGANLGQAQSFIPSAGKTLGQEENQFPALAAKFAAMNQGQIPKFNEQAISPMEAAQGQGKGGLDMEAIKASPVLRGWFKKHFGYDPATQTQEEKDRAALQLFQDKEDYKTAHPRPSASGLTEADRAADRALKRDQLNERIAHNRVLEKNATPEEKIALQKQKDELEVAKKKLIEEDKASLEYKKTLSKEEAKQYADMEKQGVEGLKSQPLYTELKDVVSNPTFEQIRQHPYLGHVELGYYKRSSNKEQAQLANRFELVANQLVASTAKNLNTRFTNKDLELAQRMKITDKDSLNGAKAKAEALIYLQELGQKRLDRALELAEGGKMRPYAAFKKADQELDSDAIRHRIEKEIENADKKQVKPANNQEVDWSSYAVGE